MLTALPRVSRLLQAWGRGRHHRLRSTLAASTAPTASLLRDELAHNHQDRDADWDSARPYSEIPGPKPLPLLGNLPRFAFGQYGAAE